MLNGLKRYWEVLVVKTLDTVRFWFVVMVALFLSAGSVQAKELVYPTRDWPKKTPQQVGLDRAKLDALRDYAGGFGCIVRHGYLVYSWGDPSRRKDVASAVKPFYTHFLFKAVEQGKLASIDEPVYKFEPRLTTLNKALGYKDRKITWRHLANQISCYGVREQPGTAFDYSDYNMALFFDTLMLKVYKTTWDSVDRQVLWPQLTSLIGCQDKPTFMAFGLKDRPGRLAISCRDFARFGLLYLRTGRWRNKQLIRPEHVRLAIRSPLPLSIPRTTGKRAEMIPGQRSIGGGNNQCDHNGSYSFAWWVNGIGRNGRRNWPDVPPDVFGCFGHGGIRAMVVLPSIDAIICWNDTRIEGDGRINRALKFLIQAVTDGPASTRASSRTRSKHPVKSQVSMENNRDRTIQAGPSKPGPVEHGTALRFDHAPCRSDPTVAVGSFQLPSPTPPPTPMMHSAKRGRVGFVTTDPQHRRWLYRHGLGPLFICGPGDPEDFLYRGTLRPDGTRDGDQDQLIAKLAPTGANCIYIMAVRSHGGDGDRTHNPFIDNDPEKGLNAKVLDQWDRWFTQMDENGIVIYLFLYDDSVRLWDTGDRVGRAERHFIETLVNRFEHHRHLIWCVAEEYGEALSPQRVRNIAAIIRAADDFDHPIAVHKNHGLDFSEFADEPNIDQFAIQYNVPTTEALHQGLVRAFHQARGRYNLNMAEAADFGTGAQARRKCWACAMAGAYVMILGMDIANTATSDLRDCGRLVRFFESTDFPSLSPHDELAAGSVRYVLARPGRSYIAYSPDASRPLGIKQMPAGTYDMRWFDCVTGRQLTRRSVKIQAGDNSWQRPDGFGPEVALYLRVVGL